MTGTTTNGIRYPDGASKPKMFGPEMKQFAEDVDELVYSKAGPIAEAIVRREVTEQLADSAVVADAAAAAVDDALDDYLDGVVLPQNLDPTTFHIVDADSGRVALEVNQQGTTTIYDLVTPTRKLGGAVERAGAAPEQYAWIDRSGRLAMQVRPDGAVFIPHLITGNDPTPGAGGGTATVDRVVVLAMLGQSNAEGRGRPISPRTDGPHDHILQWSFGAEGLTRATVPLSSQQSQVGYSPATAIAHEFIAAAGPSTRVVIVNAGVGQSGLVNDPPTGCWSIDYAGAQPKLYPLAKAAIQKAVTKAADVFGVEPEIWAYWHQGESDNDTSASAYIAALDALIGQFRTDFGSATIPFTAGGFVPERVTGTALENVRGALIALPARLAYTAYTDGIANGGGSEGTTDDTHYTRQGAVALGRAMYQASQRAATAADDQIPHRPLTVRAFRDGQTVYASWDEPDTRWTAFVVEYSVAGGAWQTAPRTHPALNSQTFTATGAGTIRVRVSSTNGAITSRPTTPVIAFGG